jgi:hypothetical protein
MGVSKAALHAQMLCRHTQETITKLDKLIFGDERIIEKVEPDVLP